MQQLSLEARPRTLDGLVGQEKIVASIRAQVEKGGTVKAWLFSGPKGSGKTSISRILALSLQCNHGSFGRPCKECRAKKTSFPIYEIPSASISRKEDVKSALSGAAMGLMGDGNYRVYLLDEAHMMSKAAQSLLLDLFEDTPETTVFIMCSTAPHEILETLRSRCQAYEMRELSYDNTTLLIEKLLKKVNSDLPADRLAFALQEKGIGSPRLIAQAVEKYYTGQSPEDAAIVDVAANVDVMPLTRALIKGAWNEASDFLLQAPPASARGLRIGLLAYLRTMLLQTKDMGDRTQVLSLAVTSLTNLQNAEDIVISSALASECYRLCVMFQKYKF